MDLLQYKTEFKSIKVEKNSRGKFAFSLSLNEDLLIIYIYILISKPDDTTAENYVGKKRLFALNHH